MVAMPTLRALYLPSVNHRTTGVDAFAACLGGQSAKWGVPCTSLHFCTDCSAAQQLLSGVNASC